MRFEENDEDLTGQVERDDLADRVERIVPHVASGVIIRWPQDSEDHDADMVVAFALKLIRAVDALREAPPEPKE